MAMLGIKCYLNEIKIHNIVQSVAKYMYRTDRDSLLFQKEVEGVKVYVEFSVNPREVCIDTVEIQDTRFTHIYERDSNVLKCWIEDQILDDYNACLTEAFSRQKNIRSDQLAEMYIN